MSESDPPVDAEQSEVDPTDAQGPVDQLGIPMSREPTIDDVRGDSGPHRNLALGCSVIAIVLVGGFWLVRMLMMG